MDYNRDHAPRPGGYPLRAEQLLAWNRDVHQGLTLTSKLSKGTQLLTGIREDRASSRSRRSSAGDQRAPPVSRKQAATEVAEKANKSASVGAAEQGATGGRQKAQRKHRNDGDKQDSKSKRAKRGAGWGLCAITSANVASVESVGQDLCASTTASAARRRSWQLAATRVRAW